MIRTRKETLAAIEEAFKQKSQFVYIAALFIAREYIEQEETRMEEACKRCREARRN